MLVKETLASLVGLLALVEASSIPAEGLVRRQNGRQRGGNNGGNTGGNNGGAAGASPTCLAANAVQSGSQNDGQDGVVNADGQIESKT